MSNGDDGSQLTGLAGAPGTPSKMGGVAPSANLTSDPGPSYESSSDAVNVPPGAMLQTAQHALHMHEDSQYWLLPDCTRVEAERLLLSKADGTFLIRRSAAGSAPFALSIAYRGVDKGVGHILIHQSNQGFGFTPPYLVYPTLKDLVVHYANHSLQEHNPQLTTTLAHPLHGPQPESHYVQ